MTWWWPLKKLPTIVESKRIDKAEILFRLSDDRWVRCRILMRTASRDFWRLYWDDSGEELNVNSRLAERILHALRKEEWAQDARAREQKS